MRKMKDSGEIWMGAIPHDWDVGKLKYVAPEQRLTAQGHYRYIGLENIECGTGRLISYSNGEESNALLTRKGDVLFGKLRPYLSKSLLVKEDASCSGEFVIMHPMKIRADFLTYITLDPAFVKQIDVSTYGTKMPRANWNYIGNLLIPIPGVAEQEEIVSYLDSRCKQIDEAISRHRQAIDKLEEYRRAVVVKAVTKGLDSGVPMKDSGVTWIGMIPSSWSVERIKFVARLASGGTPSRDHPEYWGGNIPWVTTGDLNGTKVTATMENITQLGLENSSSKVFSSGTVLVAMYGGAGTIGKCGILGGDFAINQALCAIQCDCKLDPNYLLYQMHAIRPYWMRHAAGTRKDPNISQALIANEKISVPPYVDQLKIVSELNRICTAVDNAIDRQNQIIEKLEEYRRSLIHAAVTGRIDCTKEPL